MKKDPAKFRNKYRIPSTRLQTWDYSNDGGYFITICTKNREHYFGEIVDSLQPLENYITATYWSGFELANFAEKFGTEAAQPFIEQYVKKITADPGSFERFLEFPITDMKNLSQFKEVPAGRDSIFDYNIKNRFNMLKRFEKLFFQDNLFPEAVQRICRGSSNDLWDVWHHDLWNNRLQGDR